MKQIALAVLSYESQRGTLPMAFTPNDTGAQKFGPCDGDEAPKTTKSYAGNGLAKHFFLSFILPYLERQSIHDRIKFDKDFNDGGNLPATQQDIEVFLCPSADSRQKVYATDYTALVDINDENYCKHIEAAGLASRKRPVHRLVGMLRDLPVAIANVQDGLSQTFMLFESAGKPFHYIHGVLRPSDTGKLAETEYQWASSDAYDTWGNGTGPAPECVPPTVMNCDNYSGIYSFHPAGAVFAFGDGSADFVSETIDVDTFVSLFTAAARDVPGTR